MARRVDPALTKRAIAALARAAKKAEATEEGLTDWEADFLASVKDRLETYGSAFADPDKGQLSAPLSMRQGLKVKQIGKKGEAAKGRASSDAQDKDRASSDAQDKDRASSDAPRPDAKPKARLKTRAPLQRRTGLKSKGFRKG